MDDNNYQSDSDQSDEDFCPENEQESDVSVEEDDGDSNVSNNEEESDDENKKKKKIKKSKRTHKSKLPSKKRRKTRRTNDEDETNDESLENKFKTEEKKPFNEEEEKKRTDTLWAEFLNDTKSKSNDGNVTKIATSTIPTTATATSSSSSSSSNDTKELKPPEKIKITEILDFAGEEVKVEKEVTIDEMEKLTKSGKIITATTSDSTAINSPKINTTKPLPLKRTPFPIKRPALGGSGGAGGGLNSILGQIGKKSKMSIFEKTKLDWDKFKEKEGISEELATFNRGKDGYLERQDFLQRTDLRQFEKEKELRNTTRNSKR